MTNLLRQAMPWVDRLVPFFDEGDERGEVRYYAAWCSLPQRWLYVDADAFAAASTDAAHESWREMVCNPYLWAGLEDDLPWFFGQGEEDLDADAWWGGEPPPQVLAWWLTLARSLQAALAALASSEGWRQGAMLVALVLRAAHELGIPQESQAEERLREALHAWRQDTEGGGAQP